MNEVKFNSQICTTKEQSQHLLDLGLKPETADMEIEICKTDYSITGYVSKGCLESEISEGLVELIPAWSLHRLIELLPQDIHLDNYTDTYYYFTIDPFKVIYTNSLRSWIYQKDEGCLYDKLVNTIEWTIKNNFFNKEYLKQ